MSELSTPQERALQVRQTAKQHLAALRQERLRKRQSRHAAAEPRTEAIEEPVSASLDGDEVAVSASLDEPMDDATEAEVADWSAAEESADAVDVISEEDDESAGAAFFSGMGDSDGVETVSDVPDDFGGAEGAAHEDVAHEDVADENLADENIAHEDELAFVDSAAPATDSVDPSEASDSVTEAVAEAGYETTSDEGSWGLEQDSAVAEQGSADAEGGDFAAADDAIGAGVAPEDEAQESPQADAEPSLSDVNASDLSDLPGVGPGLVWMLQKSGVEDMAGLASADAAELTRKLGLVGELVDVEYWIDCARKHAAEAA